jgi:purine nucleosidase
MANPGADPVRLIVDCDTGIDDAVALAYLAGRAGVELVAAGAVHGNVPVTIAARNTLRVLDVAGLDHVPVAVGASRPLAQPLDTSEAVHGGDGLGGTDQPAPRRAVEAGSAAEQLVRLARAHPGELSLLALGPLTNVALALLIEPDLPHLLRQVTVMGGAFGVAGNVTPWAEANIWHDPEAAALTFGAGWPLRAVGLDVTMRTLLRAGDLARIETHPSEVARFVSSILSHYLDVYEQRVGERACPVHDALAATLALQPELATWRDEPVDVELHGALTRGATVVDRRPGRAVGGAGAVVAVATVVDRDAAVAGLLDALLG